MWILFPHTDKYAERKELGVSFTASCMDWHILRARQLCFLWVRVWNSLASVHLVCILHTKITVLKKKKNKWISNYGALIALGWNWNPACTQKFSLWRERNRRQASVGFKIHWILESYLLFKQFPKHPPQLLSLLDESVLYKGWGLLRLFISNLNYFKKNKEFFPVKKLLITM